MLRKSENSRPKTIYYRGNIKTDCTIFNKKIFVNKPKNLNLSILNFSAVHKNLQKNVKSLLL